MRVSVSWVCSFVRIRFTLGPHTASTRSNATTRDAIMLLYMGERSQGKKSLTGWPSVLEFAKVFLRRFSLGGRQKFIMLGPITILRRFRRGRLEIRVLLGVLIIMGSL